MSSAVRGCGWRRGGGGSGGAFDISRGNQSGLRGWKNGSSGTFSSNVESQIMFLPGLNFWSSRTRPKLFEPKFNAVNHRIRRGRARGDTGGLCVGEPIDLQIFRCLHVMNARTKAGAGFDQFLRVVAVRAADDDDRI